MVEIWRRSCGSISFRPGFWRGVRSARCRITGPQPWYLLVCPNAGHGRGERIALSHIAGAGALLEVAALVQLLTITAGMLAGAVASAIWLKLWRYAVAVSYAASIVRSGAAGNLLSTALWPVVPFGPLAIAAVPLLTRKSASMRPIDIGILACLALFAFWAFVTAFTGAFRVQTLAQSALLVLMFGFLALTLSK